MRTPVYILQQYTKQVIHHILVSHLFHIPTAVFTQLPKNERDLAHRFASQINIHSKASLPHTYIRSFSIYIYLHRKCFAYLKTSLLFAESGRIVGTSGGSLRGPPSFPAITMLAPTSDSTKNECQWVYRSIRGAITNIKEKKNTLLEARKSTKSAHVCVCVCMS